MSSAPLRATRVVLVEALAALIIVGAGAPVFAQSTERAAATLADAIHVAGADLGEDPAVTPAAAPQPAPSPFQRAAFDVEKPRRPVLLLPLYASFATLQAMDAHSTLKAVRNGTAVERNPVLEPFGDNAGAVIALKAATTVGTVFLAEKMWRRHPVRAVLLMTAVNVAYGAIVSTNYRR